MSEFTRPGPSHEQAGDWTQYWCEFGSAQTPATMYLDPELLASIDDHDVVLDLGCGYGRAATKLAAKAHYVVGVDINASEITYAQQHNQPANVAYGVMNGGELGFENGAFDVVTLLGVASGVQRELRQSMLAEAWRVLRPGGRVYISEHTPSFGSPYAMRDYADGLRITGEQWSTVFRQDRDPDGDIAFISKHFPPEEMNEMLSKAGYIGVQLRTPTVLKADRTSPGILYEREVICAFATKPGGVALATQDTSGNIEVVTPPIEQVAESLLDDFDLTFKLSEGFEPCQLHLMKALSAHYARAWTRDVRALAQTASNTIRADIAARPMPAEHRQLEAEVIERMFRKKWELFESICIGDQPGILIEELSEVYDRIAWEIIFSDHSYLGKLGRPGRNEGSDPYISLFREHVALGRSTGSPAFDELFGILGQRYAKGWYVDTKQRELVEAWQAHHPNMAFHDF